MFDPQKDVEEFAERLLNAVVAKAIDVGSGYRLTFKVTIEAEKKEAKEDSGSPR